MLMQHLFSDFCEEPQSEQAPIQRLATKILLASTAPTRKDEEWRQTPFKLNNLSFGTEKTPTKAAFIDDEDKKKYSGENDNYCLYFVNGTFMHGCSTDMAILAKKGIHIAQSMPPQTSTKILGELEKFFRCQPMAALSLAKSLTPLHITVSKKIDKPLAIVHLTNMNGKAGIYQYGNSFIDLNIKSEASLTLLENISTASNIKNTPQYMVYNNFTNIYLEKGACLQHLTLDDSDDDTLSLVHYHITQEKNSRHEAGHVMNAGELGRKDVHVKLLDKGASANLQALMLPRDKQHFHLSTNIEHISPHCSSQQLVKAIASHQAKAVYQGKIHIHRYANDTIAHQQMRALLMDEKAMISAKPELEIYANKVECAHGVAIGDLDHEQIFYLQSRGIDKKTATALLLRAYIAEVVEKWHISPMWEKIMLASVSRQMDAMEI